MDEYEVAKRGPFTMERVYVRELGDCYAIYDKFGWRVGDHKQPPLEAKEYLDNLNLKYAEWLMVKPESLSSLMLDYPDHSTVLDMEAYAKKLSR